MTETQTDQGSRTGIPCPNCETVAEPGQLVCLNCGERLALDYRRPSGAGAAIAVVAIVLTVAAAAFFITLSAVDDDAKDEVAQTQGAKAAATTPAKPAKKQAAAPAKKAKAKPKPAKKKAATKPNDTPAKPRSVAGGGIPAWPAGKNGFMVVLISAGDKGGARSFAQKARKQGTDAGVLRSDDYSSLSKGFWIVFAGPYKSRKLGEKAAGRLGKHYSGAYVQYVNGAKRKE